MYYSLLVPSRNVLKIDVPETYYHVYARGISRGKIFFTNEDYEYFLTLLARYLSSGPVKDRNGLAYPHLYGQVEIVCYCLMTNHFHMLIYQRDTGAMKTFMRCLLTSYSRYFNKKYKRSGSLFESRYKASMVIRQQYLEHITRYIHLNPKPWRQFAYSSLQYYFSADRPEFIVPNKIEDLFESKEVYLQFLAQYADKKAEIDKTKYELPDFY